MPYIFERKGKQSEIRVFSDEIGPLAQQISSDVQVHAMVRDWINLEPIGQPDAWFSEINVVAVRAVDGGRFENGITHGARIDQGRVPAMVYLRLTVPGGTRLKTFIEPVGIVRWAGERFD